ncbi:lipid A biosynthesis lauroyl acyltransferase, partial [Enterobacter cloacae]
GQPDRYARKKSVVTSNRTVSTGDMPEQSGIQH